MSMSGILGAITQGGIDRFLLLQSVNILLKSIVVTAFLLQIMLHLYVVLQEKNRALIKYPEYGHEVSIQVETAQNMATPKNSKAS